MSFDGKEFWIPKGIGHVSDDETVFDGSSTLGPKRAHQWLAETTEQELISNKKQAIEASSVSKPDSSSLSWDNLSTFQSIPNQFVGRLFGSEQMEGSVCLGERNLREKVIGEELGNDSFVGLSMSYNIEEPESCINYGGVRKVKVNQVKEQNIGFPMNHQEVYNERSEEAYISMGQGYGKQVDDSNNNSPFSGYQEDADIDALGRPISSYEYFYNQSTVQTSPVEVDKDLDRSNLNTTIVCQAQVTKSIPKTKSDEKPAKKEAPNSFPSNVRSLMSTGMLDGVPVKYVSVSREGLIAENLHGQWNFQKPQGSWELPGVIKGSGYLCGCQTCNYSKALNAYEFERHAGCKTKHPNNHIYFENGKTIYQIVQELRSTRESELFVAIQSVTGSPINQKAFKIWKESYQAATRELRRIYGKEELNL